MLITHFNKLIRNKIVWGVFASLVVIAWVGFDTTNRSRMRDQVKQSAEGSLFGKDVSTREFYQARSFEVGFRDKGTLSDEEQREIRKHTWARLAAVRMAQDMKLGVTDAEINDAIQRDPTFAVNGAFSPERYLNFVTERLKVEPQTFEEYLRQELAIRKLAAGLESLVWTAPSELNERLDELTDNLSADYATVSNTIKIAESDITDAQAKSYFEQNRAAFRIPERVSVKYVTFPVSNYVASTTVEEAAMRDYYDDHLGDYSMTDTNGLTVARPFDTVKDGIHAILLRQEAAFKARDAATEFAVALTPDSKGNAPTFEAAAQARSMSVSTTALFSIDEPLPALKESLDFNKAAFKLDPNDPSGYFSDAISGSNSVYIIAANTREESRDPSFEEARARVIPLARAQAEQDAFARKMTEIRNTLIGKLASSNTFLKAAAAFTPDVHTTGVFSVYQGLPQGVPHGQEIVAAVVDLRKGEMSQPIFTEGGAMLVYLVSREPGSATARETVKPQLLKQLDRFRTGAILSDWANYVLAKAKLRDYRPIEPHTDGGETNAESSVPEPVADPGI